MGEIFPFHFLSFQKMFVNKYLNKDLHISNPLHIKTV